MKRIFAASVLATLMAVSAQAQNSGLTAAGSNFTGPGGGGGGVTGTVGAFLPSPAGGTSGGGFTAGTGMPSGGTASSFSGATAPANVQVGNLTVSVSANAQQAVAGAVVNGNVAGFTTSLGGAVPTTQAAALGNALASLGTDARGGSPVAFASALSNAIAAFNAAVNAIPAGTAVPQSLIAARALIAGYYQ